MGLDILIEARIREKETGRLISYNDCYFFDDENDEYDDEGYFEICYWRGRRQFSDLVSDMIEVCNAHAGTSFTSMDYDILLPLSALHDIYACILEYSPLHLEKYNDNSDNEINEGVIDWRKADRLELGLEKINLENAAKLHPYLIMLLSIRQNNEIPLDDYDYANKKYIGKPCFDEKYIPDKEDLARLMENPQGYEWEFRIVNSY